MNHPLKFLKGTVGIKSTGAEMKEIFCGTSKGSTANFKISFVCIHLINGNFGKTSRLNQAGRSPLLPFLVSIRLETATNNFE